MTDAPVPTDVPLRIRTHPSLCLGWGECHRWAPEVFPLDEDGRVGVHLLAVPADQADAARWGAAACPEQAITVIEPGPGAGAPHGAIHRATADGER